MNMGQKINQLRLQKGFTLEELGNLVGVGKSTVRKWENGMIANMKRDKIKSIVCGMTSLGLVEMTRKRTTHSLIKNYCDICPICNGTGHIFSPQLLFQNPVLNEFL